MKAKMILMTALSLCAAVASVGGRCGEDVVPEVYDVAEPALGVGRRCEASWKVDAGAAELVVGGCVERVVPAGDATVFTNRPFRESEWVRVVATAYCGCSECCGAWADVEALRPGEDVIGGGGVPLTEGVSVAARSEVFPLGTVLEVYGVGVRVVEDYGVAHDGVDVYFTDHEDAVEFGVQEWWVHEITK